MKLLGVEFHEFACFDHQFVRLPSGILLLAGKNNSGKTAILRGLSLLACLPFGTTPETRPFKFDIGPYCRRHDPEPHVQFDVLYEVEPGDFKYFCEPVNENLIASVEAQKPYIRFNFTAWAARNSVALERAMLCLYRDPDFAPREIIGANGGGFFLNCYQTSRFEPFLGNLLRASRITQATSGVIQMPNQTFRAVLAADFDLLRPLRDLEDVRLVAAHRVPHPQMALQSTPEMPADANNLASHLQTLQNNERSKFMKVERFLTDVFPEFEYVNPSNKNNQVSITLTLKQGGSEIPLVCCGTGVEQLITLATFALTSGEDCVLLMDEPHSFLHPSAERKLVRFVNENTKRHVVISTHSAILMNSVEADRVVYLQPPGAKFDWPMTKTEELSRILLDLGYKNSDALFHDYLLAVEGESDRDILKILLSQWKGFPSGSLDRTGFPIMEGAGSGAIALQIAILRFEKLLEAIGRAMQPRLYLFDGDKTTDDKNLLAKTKANAYTPPVRFLPRLEIENYLISSAALASAMKEQAVVDSVVLPAFDVDDVQVKLDELLQSDDPKLFPHGKVGDPLYLCKGSVLLKKVFEHFGNQRYDKKRSGILTANCLVSTKENGLEELADLVEELFI